MLAWFDPRTGPFRGPRLAQRRQIPLVGDFPRALATKLREATAAAVDRGTSPGRLHQGSGHERPVHDEPVWPRSRGRASSSFRGSPRYLSDGTRSRRPFVWSGARVARLDQTTARSDRHQGSTAPSGTDSQVSNNRFILGGSTTSAAGDQPFDQSSSRGARSSSGIAGGNESRPAIRSRSHDK